MSKCKGCVGARVLTRFLRRLFSTFRRSIVTTPVLLATSRAMYTLSKQNHRVNVYVSPRFAARPEGEPRATGELWIRFTCSGRDQYDFRCVTVTSAFQIPRDEQQRIRRLAHDERLDQVLRARKGLVVRVRVRGAECGAYGAGHGLYGLRDHACARVRSRDGGRSGLTAVHISANQRRSQLAFSGPKNVRDRTVRMEKRTCLSAECEGNEV